MFSLKYSLKQLRYFVAAGQAGSVTKAAGNLHISQPSISAAIFHLEEVFGTRLFVRYHAKGLALTGSGKRIFAKAIALLKQAEELQHAAEDRDDEVGGTLDVGCFVTLAPVILPSLIKCFRKQYPKVRINCHEADQDGIYAGLQSGNMDVALTYELDIPNNLVFQPLVKYPPFVIVAKQHKYALRKRISLTEFIEEPMVLLDLPHSRQYFESIFAEVDAKPRIEYRTSSPHLVRSMVANGLGYSIMNIPTGTDRCLDGKEFRRIKLRENLRPTVMGIIRLQDVQLTRAADAFVEHCRKRLKKFPEKPL